jgi:hypothetical protein
MVAQTGPVPSYALLQFLRMDQEGNQAVQDLDF